MAWYSFDVETYKKDSEGTYRPILDGTGKHFVLGCITNEKLKSTLFYNKEDMWQYMIEKAEKSYSKKRVDTYYAHNVKYDFFNIVNWNDSNIRIHNEEPFLASYIKRVEKTFKNLFELEKYEKYLIKNNLKYEKDLDKLIITKENEIMRFADSGAIFTKKSLKELGKIIGLEKLDLPKDLGKKIVKDKIERMKKYVTRDSEIVIKSMLMLKEKLESESINIKRYCTISQIAMSYLINRLRKIENGLLFKNKEGKYTEIIKKAKYYEEVHSSYKGGRTECWKLGFLPNVTAIDCNSMYSKAITEIAIPDMNTEKKIHTPLRFYNQDFILNSVGFSRVLLKNVSNDIGFLQVRKEDRSYCPRKGKLLIGTWVNSEIKKALENGYELIDIEWSVVYFEIKNPFKIIYDDLYKKRVNSGSKFDYWFYKCIMNHAIGKFAQKNYSNEIVIDSVEKRFLYEQKGYEVVGSKGYNYFYRPTKLPMNLMNKHKKYYCPIISSLVNSYARCYMYDYFKKVGLNDLVYTDTDNVIFRGNHRDKFKMGNGLGEFKVEKDVETNEDLVNVNCKVYGIKSKMVGNNINVSGVSKKNLNKEAFNNGILKQQKMLGINNAGSVENIGSFVEFDRDLLEQMQNYVEENNEYNLIDIHVDCDIKDLSFFEKYLM